MHFSETKWNKAMIDLVVIFWKLLYKGLWLFRWSSNWTQLTVKLSHKEKPCPVFNLDDNCCSVSLHSQFGMRERIRPQQLVGLLYPFIAKFVGSAQQFQPEQRLLFGLRRHNEIVREQDRLRLFALQFLLLDRIGMRMALGSNLWIVLLLKKSENPDKSCWFY